MKDYLYSVITGKATGVIPALLLGLLTPLSYIYAVVVKTRGWLYNCRLLKQKQLPCTVISVGNIVAGGTGKTPAVIWIAKTLQDAGCRIAILLRGYHRQKGVLATEVVSNGRKVLASAETSGDEATMIARELPSVPVLVGKNRYTAGHQALQRWNLDVLILDDGFQHQSLARDVEIVAVDATQPFGTGRLLPAGTLREPVSALRQADLILLTRIDLVKSPIEVSKKIESLVGKTPIVESCYHPTKLYRLGIGEEFDFSLLKGKRVFAVCGIGNPEAFAEMVRQCEPQHVDLLPFPDHHRYSKTDFSRVQNEAKQSDADLLITTSKDEPKLQPFLTCGEDTSVTSGELPIYVFVIELSITAGMDMLTQRLQECVSKKSVRR